MTSAEASRLTAGGWKKDSFVVAGQASGSAGTRDAVAAPTIGEWLTVERALWVGVIVLATLPRLWNLGGLTLQPGEAAAALHSWQMVQGQGGDASDGAMLSNGNALIFLVFGANDASARLLPAVAGALLVGLPLLLRPQLGRWGALLAALLLSTSPTILYFSRLVDSEILVCASGLASVAFLARAGWRDGHRWSYATGIAVGLLALSGRNAYTMMVVLGGAAASVAWLPRTEKTDPKSKLRAAGANSYLPRTVVVAAAVVVLGATALLANPHGIQEALGNTFGHWLSGLRGGAQPWHFPLQSLMVYEAETLLFGLIGAVSAFRGGSTFGRFLVFWTALAFLVTALSGERPGAGITLVIVPLALLGGPAIVGILRRLCTVPHHELAIFLGTSLALLALSWIATEFFTLPGQTLPATVPLGPLTLSLRTIGSIVVPSQIILTAGTILAVALWIGSQHLPHLLALLAMVVLLAVAVHAAVLLNYVPYASAAELLVPTRGSADVRVLAGDVADAVDAFGARSGGVRVATQHREVPAWYLREQRGLRFGNRALPDDTFVIADIEADPPPGRFAALHYRLESTWFSGPKDTSALWRWLTLRESPGPINHDDVVLYVRLP